MRALAGLKLAGVLHGGLSILRFAHALIVQLARRLPEPPRLAALPARERQRPAEGHAGGGAEPHGHHDPHLPGRRARLLARAPGLHYSFGNVLRHIAPACEPEDAIGGQECAEHGREHRGDGLLQPRPEGACHGAHDEARYEQRRSHWHSDRNRPLEDRDGPVHGRSHQYGEARERGRGARERRDDGAPRAAEEAGDADKGDQDDDQGPERPLREPRVLLLARLH
mmetsp:Transcript_45612/g.130146  ORF Transcript_45612/g.130146 Transcript_45612/m.130146 type:complete len:225 (+) Transcript_45612:76-750(+)